MQVIGATTLEEYRLHIEKDAALERRFQPVRISEPDADESRRILSALRPKLQQHHGLTISDEALDAAVRLSVRYIGDRFLPDKAIDLVDEAASRVRMQALRLPETLHTLDQRLTVCLNELEQAAKRRDFETAARLKARAEALRERSNLARAGWEQTARGHVRAVTGEDVAQIVALWTGIPVTAITSDESERLLHLEDVLRRRVVGQDEAVSAVASAIRRSRVGLGDPNRPIGSFLFLGPTGVGKTELCRALAEALFGDERAIIRIDMSEYMEKHATARLIGSPPGYVGHEEGGQLTEKVRRRPYSVVLFDEIEKAHEDVFNLLLQVMEDGRLTDSLGREADFRNTVIVMTSNTGARAITDGRGKLGFSGEQRTEPGRTDAEIRSMVMEDLKRTFRPEFLNRVDEIIVFHRLTPRHLRTIAQKLLCTLSERMERAGVHLTVPEAALELVAKRGYDPRYGARPLRRVIRTELEDPAAKLLLSGEAEKGDCLTARVEGDKIILTNGAEHDKIASEP